jgi:type IV secretion system protein VirB9
MRTLQLLCLLILTLVSQKAAFALDIPAPGSNDSRIRFITYKPNDVILVLVQRGVVTRIMLEADEKIETSVVGFSSRCDSDLDEWCISSSEGSNQIFVRPRDKAQHNNMELHTNKRDYSFAFVIAGEQGVFREKRGAQIAGSFPYFRVVLEYPKPVIAALPAESRAAAVEDLLRRVDKTTSRPLPLGIDPDYGMSAARRLQTLGPTVRNSNYTKQVLPKGDDADPTAVFDDGRFTYFEFLGARDIPAIFAYGSDDQPTRVNWHMQGTFVVVQRTARKFTLRMGEAVVGVFNESFDPTGIDTPNSTVSPSVSREVKGAVK